MTKTLLNEEAEEISHSKVFEIWTRFCVPQFDERMEC